MARGACLGGAMADNDYDTLIDQISTEVGATPAETPSETPSAVEDSAPAGAERADTAPAKEAADPRSETEQIVDQFLGKFPAKEGNEFDPAPKPAPSDGADKPADQPQDAKPGDDRGKGPETPEPDGKDDSWLSKEEMDKLGPKAKARIENLWRENREHRQFVDQAEPFLKPIRDAGLPVEDVQIIAQLARAVNDQDWTTFHKAVKPYMELAEQALGLALPEDLRKRVDDGEMTEEAATEISRTRHTAASAQIRARRLEEQRQVDTQQRESLSEQQATEAVSTAINTWEQQQRARDPDYQRLRPLILDKMVAFVHRHGPPPNADMGVKLAIWARQEVLKAIPGRPAARATTPQPQPNGSAKTPMRAPPKDVYDHVFQRLGIS